MGASGNERWGIKGLGPHRIVAWGGRFRGWRAIVSSLLLDTVERHKSGEGVGIYSVCSAQPTPTSADAARATLAAHENAFYAEGLEGVWNRVIALVVQPGVEFDLERVIDYDRSATRELRRVLDDRGRL